MNHKHFHFGKGQKFQNWQWVFPFHFWVSGGSVFFQRDHKTYICLLLFAVTLINVELPIIAISVIVPHIADSLHQLVPLVTPQVADLVVFQENCLVVQRFVRTVFYYVFAQVLYWQNFFFFFTYQLLNSKKN
jgi:hypothetical protein